MTRVFNFSAGPATLPESVLRQAAEDMLDWQGCGMGVMEMSHRGPEFMRIHAQALADFRELLAIPETHTLLFMQGGAIAENAIIPMNLMGIKAKVDFIVTGSWSQKSLKEARKYGTVNVAANPVTDGLSEGFTTIPNESTWRLSDDPAYVHVCTNETIDGVAFHHTPEVGGRVLVADMSSDILSRPIDVLRYGVIFGGAQKNIGPAGLTFVIVRKDLLGHALPYTPSAFDWKVVADNDSMYNTPPTYSIYIAGLVFQWMKAQGGVAAMEANNVDKALMLYDCIDRSGLYENRVDPAYRSRMNVPFFLKDDSLNAAFLKGAQERGLVQLKGHKSVGGMRASLYNAMPLEGVQALVEFMRDFERQA